MPLKKIRKPSYDNPFYDGIDIPDELFCDRKEETQEIIRLLQNGNKVVLKAPRRIGKSALITHILKQKEISDKYNTLYVDIMGTSNATEFVREFQKEFSRKKFTALARVKEQAKSLPNKLAFETEQNPLTAGIINRLGFFELKSIEMELDDIFYHLEHTSKPNIVVFDEFQQIKYYPEQMEAILRAHIQKLNNTSFIFSGSSRRMLTIMFNYYGEPFYHSAEPIDLQIISETKYEEFCKKNFSDYNKAIESEAIEFAYDLTAGNTYEIQRIMREVFSFTGIGEKATKEDVSTAVEKILDRVDQTYREKLAGLGGTKERKVFLAIAIEGIATEMLSQKMINLYNLGAASSVAQSLKFLCDENKLNLVLKIGSAYKLQDKMFELWIARQYNMLNEKFALAKQQFKKEIEAGKNIKLPKFNIPTHK